jgi:hypothetical protein
MTDKDFVLKIMPEALCLPLDQSPFGTGPQYSQDNPMYVVYAMDGHGREYVVGHSLTSEEDAWFQVAESFRQKMLLKLEA